MIRTAHLPRPEPFRARQPTRRRRRATILQESNWCSDCSAAAGRRSDSRPNARRYESFANNLGCTEEGAVARRLRRFFVLDSGKEMSCR